MSLNEKDPKDAGEPESRDTPAEEQGPDAADLDKDPAYEPDDPDLKKIKGG
jgi:hypothetical protein